MMDFCGFFQEKSSEFAWIPEIPYTMHPAKKVSNNYMTDSNFCNFRVEFGSGLRLSSLSLSLSLALAPWIAYLGTRTGLRRAKVQQRTCTIHFSCSLFLCYSLLFSFDLKHLAVNLGPRSGAHTHTHTHTQTHLFERRQTQKTVNYEAVAFLLLCPDICYGVSPCLRKNACKTEESGVCARWLGIAKVQQRTRTIHFSCSLFLGYSLLTFKT